MLLSSRVNSAAPNHPHQTGPDAPSLEGVVRQPAADTRVGTVLRNRDAVGGRVTGPFLLLSSGRSGQVEGGGQKGEGVGRDRKGRTVRGRDWSVSGAYWSVVKMVFNISLLRHSAILFSFTQDLTSRVPRT